MAIPGSPLWYVEKLEEKREKDHSKIATYGKYYEGDHPLPLAEERIRLEFMRLLTASRCNFTGMVVEALVDRLHVQGFRLNANDKTGDADAWAIWQANQLDAWSEMVHTEAATSGESYVSVWNDPDNPEVPLIVPEHPLQMTIMRGRNDKRQIAAALKVWNDEWTSDRWATLYLPDAIYKYKAPEHGGMWTERADSIDNPLNEVPVVAFQNRPRLLKGGRSEIEDCVDIQDRINLTLFFRLIASEFAGAIQRYAIGMDLEVDASGQPKPPPFKHMVDRLWVAENPNVKFGEFSATDLRPFIASVEADVNAMATISRTPPQYLLGAMVNISGDALKAADSGHSKKAESRTKHYGESWERVMHLAFAVLEDPRAKVTDSQTIWADVEIRSEGERVDALVKMRSLGVPLEAIWERWGATPEEITRWKAQLAEEPPPNPGEMPAA